ANAGATAGQQYNLVVKFGHCDTQAKRVNLLRYRTPVLSVDMSSTIFVIPCRAILVYGQKRSVLRTSFSALARSTPGKRIRVWAVRKNNPSMGSRLKSTWTSTELSVIGIPSRAASKLKAP